MPLQIVRNDITRMRVDAIVNAANEGLRHGGGVCGAIFAAAGASKMEKACSRIGHCDTGSSVATPGFNLPARHVIHTVGPVWRGGTYGEEEALRSCYQTALECALELNDTSVAFPLISSGIYGYPKDQAIDVALYEIRAFLDRHEMDVYLTIFDAESLRSVHGRFSDIAEYIDDTYVRSSPFLRRDQWERTMPAAGASSAPMETGAPVEGERTAEEFFEATPCAPMAKPSVLGSAGRVAPKQRTARKGALERLLKGLDASFSTTLLQMIDERDLKDSDVYKRANMSRQHFSKIRSNKAYKPKKQTVLALAVALQLSLDETRLLLERAGFALTHADERDVIVEYFIRQGDYDIYEINLALYAFDQPLLG